MANRHITDVQVVNKSDAVEQPSVEDVKVVETVEETPAPALQVDVDVDADDDTPQIPRPDNPIKLSNPILINGKTRDSLTWTEEITTDQFLKADAEAHTGRVSASVAELDSGFNLALGRMMIVAANHEIDFKDLDQLRGFDIMSVMRLGRFFTNQSGV